MIRGIGITTTTVGQYMIDITRDLARKAGLIAPYGSDHEGLRDFDYKKFAELIIRESISQIEEVRAIKVSTGDQVYNQAFDDGLLVAIRTLEGHFGVE